MSSSIILVIGLVLSVAGMLGVSYAVFKSATVTKTIELLETENTALSKSLDRQRSDLTVLQDRVGQLEQANRVLQNVVTGRAEIEALTKFAETEAKLRREEHRILVELAHEVRDLVQEMWRAIPRLLGNGK